MVVNQHNGPKGNRALTEALGEYRVRPSLSRQFVHASTDTMKCVYGCQRCGNVDGMEMVIEMMIEDGWMKKVQM